MENSSPLEDRLDSETIGRLQVSAGAGLLVWSRLTVLDESDWTFKAATRSAFAADWVSVEPTFGRLICWMAFAAGAEYLGKGVCLLNGLGDKIRKEKLVLAYPSPEERIDKWAEKVLTKDPPMVSRPTFGTMGQLVNSTGNSPFQSLATKTNLSDENRTLLIAGYRLLASAIRNRDAHFYTPGVREDHFDLIESVFVRCLNILVGCLPGGGGALGKWLPDAPKFIQNIFD